MSGVVTRVFPMGRSYMKNYISFDYRGAKQRT